ncbi:MAG: hypothetical protein QOE80_3688 [Actinomycetota bacterium]|nr:hypothetical protein [Actinomycetota bacterium]
MRKLLTMLAGVTLAVGLAAPAWADTAQKPADRPITASGDRGHSGGRGGGRGGGRDSGRSRRGSDRTGFDRSRRDDRYGSYRDRYDYRGSYYDRYDDGCGYGYGYGYYGCNDPYGYRYGFNASAPGADTTSATPSPSGGYGDRGSEERPTRFGSASDDPPGEGRSHYDKLHHNDDDILF